MTRADDILKNAREAAARLEDGLGAPVHDAVASALHGRATALAAGAVSRTGGGRDWTRAIDRVVTSRLFGVPLMLALLGAVFWFTIAGANVPSALLADGLFWVEDQLASFFAWMGSPAWLTGFLVHGVYKGLAWVVAVMLPPMAIFFPIFTMLENLGYLPRVAFNLDHAFRRVGAHGKQALSMSMGFGCNAAGVISTRIIESPRERLVAILTNNFVPCNGRWPTLIMVAGLFVAAAVPAAWGSLAALGAVVLVSLVGIIATFAVSKLLTSTVLEGTPSGFQLELPPYRRPRVMQILYTSLIDRTLFVLGRAVAVAAPAGGIIWLLANIEMSAGGGAGGEAVSLFMWLSNGLDGVAAFFGLDGVILLAFIVAVPANEIVVPTIIMGYMAAGGMLELDDMDQLRTLFVDNGWTLTTAVCLMLFSVLHYPCSTTTWTIWKETRSVRWTVLSNVLPLGLALVVCAVVANLASLF